MTLPRRVLAGNAIMVTRRCTQRQFLLRPDPVVDQVLTYCLVLAAKRHGIEIFSLVFLSNHFHLGCVDPGGHLPKFMSHFASLAARALNVHHKRGENLWAPGSYSAVTLANREAVLDKIAYMIANPIAAGLVEAPEAWPGLISTPADLCRRELVARRPTFFFRQDKDDEEEDETASSRARRRYPASQLQPQEVRLKLSRPPGLEDLDDDGVRALVAERVATRVAEIHSTRLDQGRVCYLGADAVRLQRPTDTPGSSMPSFDLNPRLACRDRWRRVQLLQDLVEFWAAHREASARFRAGERDVHFPPGTYGYVVNFGARCRPTSPT
jgi:REP element-mobilizing transposase RayT